MPASGSIIVGVTTDVTTATGAPKAECAMAYTDAITAAGATPILLPPVPDHVEHHIARCSAFVLTGGDDPRTEPFGCPTHPKASPVHPLRQEYETRLLRAVNTMAPRTPVLGVCLGMQMMALMAGGRLNQHLPDTQPGATRHWDADHHIVSATPLFPSGSVRSRHRQAVEDPGSLTILARADDGIIEAVGDPDRRFYLGVQWHPERTEHPALGRALFAELVRAAQI